MSLIKVVAFDPSMSNFGICLATVDANTLKPTIEDLQLIKTEPETKKGVKKVSDDIRRAKEVLAGMRDACEGRALAIVEVPLGVAAQYNHAIFNSGLVTGVLAACPIPLIQVFPQDVKVTAIGRRQAAKEEMIEWAMEKYPSAPWRMRRFGNALRPIADNEHLADAVAILETGLKTTDFAQAASMYRAFAEVKAA